MSNEQDLVEKGPITVQDGVNRLIQVLKWYGEQARLARLIHSGGDSGRQALAGDGGQHAREAIEAYTALSTQPSVADEVKVPDGGVTEEEEVEAAAIALFQLGLPRSPSGQGYQFRTNLEQETWRQPARFILNAARAAISTQPSVADVREALVEPVARAICKAVRPSHNPDDYQTDERKLWQWFEAQARAALNLAKDCE